MEAWRCAAFLAVLAESLSVDEERGLMDHRRVRTSRLPPLSRREKPCLRAGGCRGGFAGGELFRVGRYVSTGAREVVRDFERKMRHCVRRREKSFSSFLFRFRGNCGKVSPGGYPRGLRRFAHRRRRRRRRRRQSQRQCPCTARSSARCALPGPSRSALRRRRSATNPHALPALRLRACCGGLRWPAPTSCPKPRPSPRAKRRTAPPRARLRCSTL